MIAADLDGNGVDEVIVDFPGAGIWVLKNNANWIRLHVSSPTRMAVGDLDGNGRADVTFDFPGAGLWTWRNDSEWRQLHASSSSSMVVGDLDGNGHDKWSSAFLSRTLGLSEMTRPGSSCTR